MFPKQTALIVKQFHGEEAKRGDPAVWATLGEVLDISDRLAVHEMHYPIPPALKSSMAGKFGVKSTCGHSARR